MIYDLDVQEKPRSFISKEQSMMLKGVFILVMIYYHSVSSSTDTIASPFIKTLFSNIGNVCVTIFAFISIYGLTKKVCQGNSLKNYYRKRFLSLYKSYWPVWIIVFSVTIFFRKIYQYFGVGWQAFGKGIVNFFGLTHLIYGDDNVYTLNQTWWYMSLALLIVAVTPFVAKMNRIMNYVGLVISVIVAVIFKNVYFQYLPLIFIGVLTAKNDKNINKTLSTKKTVIITAVSVFEIVCWACIRVLLKTPYGALLNVLVTVPLINVFNLFFIVSPKPIKRVLCFLGKHSGNMFYTHSFIYYYWPTRRIVHILNYGFFVFVVTVLGSVAFSIVLEFLKEKTKWNKLFDTFLLKN